MKYEIKVNEFGDIFYYVNNVLHREEGPAIKFANGSQEWYKNGKCHREDGPAVECFNGYKEWYLNDKLYGIDDKFTNQSWKTFIRTLIFS